MSLAEATPPASGTPDPEGFPFPTRPDLIRRPFRKRLMHVVRRGHLYLGLFLLPWAILYGVTGFLFNHPTAFADQQTVSVERSHLVGTPMESPTSPAEVAEQVVAALRTRSESQADYRLTQPEKAKYTREFAFATVKADEQDVSVLLAVTGNGGTIRSRAATPPPKPEEKAPLAIGANGTSGKAEVKRERPTGERPRGPSNAIALDSPLPDRVRATIPVVLERNGLPTGEVTVTSVPDLSFFMSDGVKEWQVTFNAQSGMVAGKSAADLATTEELSTRRFLTRLHLAHGYPGEQNARWFWAVIVDAMAFVMVFWGVSGLFMWWQIKATRKCGFLILLVSLAAATALGLGMHDILTTK